MRSIKHFFAAFTLFAACSLALASCGSDSEAGTARSFCDTVCFKDTLHFIDSSHPLEPYVTISPNNCNADTITWGYGGGGSKVMAFKDMIGAEAKINKDALMCLVKDTAYAWLVFNDCSNGRGYVIRIPFGKGNMQRKSSAVNRFDPKFVVDPSLVCYSDRGNLMAEDMRTGKQATMTFGQRIDIDYDVIHQYIDSVNVSPTRMWARVKVGDAWKVFEKDITLK